MLFQPPLPLCVSFLFDLFTAVCLRGPDGVSPEERVAFLLNTVPLPDPGQRLALRCFPGVSPTTTSPPSRILR